MANDEHAGVIDGLFKRGFYSGNHANLDDRKSRERKKTRTPKEKKRKLIRTQSINFRTTPETHALLKALAKSNNMTMTEVLEHGLDLFAASRGQNDA